MSRGIGYYQHTAHGYQIKVLAPGVDAEVFAICRCAGVYGQSCWCPHNRSVPPCEECEQGAPPHHFVWCPLYKPKGPARPDFDPHIDYPERYTDGPI